MFFGEAVNIQAVTLRQTTTEVKEEEEQEEEGRCKSPLYDPSFNQCSCDISQQVRGDGERSRGREKYDREGEGTGGGGAKRGKEVKLMQWRKRSRDLCDTISVFIQTMSSSISCVSAFVFGLW